MRHDLAIFRTEVEWTKHVGAQFAARLAAGESGLFIGRYGPASDVLDAVRDADARTVGDLVIVDPTPFLRSCVTKDGVDLKGTWRMLTGWIQPRSDTPRLNVYGELGQLLWQRGDPQALVLVESLWNAALRNTPVEVERVCCYCEEQFVAPGSGKWLTQLAHRHGNCRFMGYDAPSADDSEQELLAA